MINYFLYFDITKKIDYNFIISLYDIADYNTTEQCYNIIKYDSLRKLAEVLQISISTLTRIINNRDYNNYFIVNKQEKTIKLLNNFKDTENKKPFVILTKREVNILKNYHNNMLYKYFIYVKYYCGYSKSKEQDFTAKQFLTACGMSIKSNDNISKISHFNKILTENKLIKIQKKHDERGHERNIYSLYNSIG